MVLLVEGLLGIIAATQRRGNGREVTASELHFGDFTLDPSRFQLQKGERRLSLEKLPMELLILLVERQGELVTREEISERLWGKEIFLDVDHSINVAIRKVRIVLRDDPEKPRFVETVVGKGYRFAAPVVPGRREPIQTPTNLNSADTATAATPGISPFSSRNSVALRYRWVVLVSLATVVLLSGLWFLRRTPRQAAGQRAIRSLAVLPLKNLSGDSTQEYLADGLTEDLIGRLAGTPGLKVISRTSSMHFKDTQLSIPEIAKILKVDAFVEGSVIREGNQIRVHAQLIRAASDEHIWAGEYEREYGNVLALQEELAGNIAERIEASLTPRGNVGPARERHVDFEAYEDYLKGRYYFNQRTVDALNRSVDYFQQAIGKDPSFALAYSGLADTYALLGFRGRVPSKDAVTKAKAAALRAVELDDSLADPHASLAFIAETQWDWPTAEQEYKRSLQLNPDDGRAHHWYAGYLTYVGSVGEGIEEEERARELDPLSLPINNALAGRLLAAGRNDDALRQVQKTIELDSHFPQAHQTLGWIYLNTGKREDAIREFRSALQLSGPEDSDLMLDLGFAYAVTGNRNEARKILGKLKELHDRRLVDSAGVGILYGALGDSDEAFAWLERAYAEHDPELTYIKTGRRFQPLRHDPRYRDLVRRIGLPV